MEKSRKPDDTNFKQQRLKAWQPILTPWWVIGTFFVVGIIFLPVGVTLKNESDDVVEQIVQYDGAGATSACKGVTDSSGKKTCTVTFTTQKEMKMPVYVYYSLHNFYQNHRRYVKSRSDKQLRGETQTAAEVSDCDPLVNNKNGALLNPCGLIANSLFSDIITLQSASGYSLNENNIAWKSDIDNKFKNPILHNMNDECLAACTEQGCQKALADGAIEQWRGDGNKTAACGGKCTWAKAYDSAKCQADPAACKSSTQYLWQSYPDIIPKIPFDPKFQCKNKELYGVTNEHFIVWMRTAGLPNFRKLYGRIESSTTDVIPAKTTLSFDVDASFVVETFKGKKFLVISTASWFGGKNSFLGIAYIVVGALCLVLSGLFFTKHRMSPRKLGDTRYLVWKDRN
jgi:hypothetical protein